MKERNAKPGRKKHGWMYRVFVIFASTVAIVAGTLWAISPFTYTYIAIPVKQTTTIELAISSGSIQFSYGDSLTDPAQFICQILQYESHFEWNAFFSRQFNWDHHEWIIDYADGSRAGNNVHITVPLWCLAILTPIWSIAILVRRIRTQPRTGLCAPCGYDLRGSTGSVTCPECGKAITKSAVSDV